MHGLQPAARCGRVSLLLLTGLVAVSGSACRRQRGQTLTRPAAAVEAAVRPERFAPGFRKLGRAHFRSVARFEAGLEGAAMDTVTTETDIWMDDKGNWRLVELNDKDGGREIVLHGRELSVALRYGKMIRRAAEDPEPQRLLEEGIGAPFAAWDLLQSVSTVDDFGEETRAGRKVHVYKMTKSPHPAPPVEPESGPGQGVDRRAWRRTLVADVVEGTIVIDQASGLPLQADFRAQYTMHRPAGGTAVPNAGAAGGGAGGANRGEASPPVRMRGALKVHASIEELGQSPVIARPEAEDLPQRQRTVPEEKALLGGLPRSAPQR